MATKKLIVTSDCRFEGKHLAKGTRFEVDVDSKAEAGRLAPLVVAERIALATPDVVAAIDAELKAEEKRARALDALANRGGPEVAAK